VFVSELEKAGVKFIGKLLNTLLMSRLPVFKKFDRPAFLDNIFNSVILNLSMLPLSIVLSTHGWKSLCCKVEERLIYIAIKC
jgi:hypothetical protein